MIPLKTVSDLISKHALLEKELSSAEIDKNTFDDLIYRKDLIADEWKIYPTSVTTTSDKDNTEVYVFKCFCKPRDAQHKKRQSFWYRLCCQPAARIGHQLAAMQGLSGHL